jgi:hypothetical protein
MGFFFFFFFVVSAVPVSWPCSCTSDGNSGSAHVIYNGYLFEGCGSHWDYHYQNGGAGYQVVWCYANHAPSCKVPAFSFNNKNSLWGSDTQWRTCTGHRCKARRGTQLKGTIVLSLNLDAPYDWPDCCKLCDQNGTACANWMFQPNTGTCSLFSQVSGAVDLASVSTLAADWSLTGSDPSWSLVSAQNSATKGYNQPVLTCLFGRDEYDLCVNQVLVCITVASIISGLTCFFLVFDTLEAVEFARSSVATGYVSKRSVRTEQRLYFDKDGRPVSGNVVVYRCTLFWIDDIGARNSIDLISPDGHVESVFGPTRSATAKYLCNGVPLVDVVLSHRSHAYSGSFRPFVMRRSKPWSRCGCTAEVLWYRFLFAVAGVFWVLMAVTCLLQSGKLQMMYTPGFGYMTPEVFAVFCILIAMPFFVGTVPKSLFFPPFTNQPLQPIVLPEY